MAKGVQNLGDPDISPDEFPRAEQGKHTVYGVDRWISKDDKDFPVFKESNGQLKVLFALLSRGKDIGPAMALSSAELFVFADAFGISLDIPKNERTTTETLIKVKDAINQSGKELVVECGEKGFANLPDNLKPPTGLYAVKFVAMERPDREPDNLNFQATEYGLNLFMKWQIVGDVKGPCKYDGWEIYWRATNQFIDQYKIDDKIVNAEVLTFDRTTVGGVPKDATRWYNFIEHFAPGVLDHEWQRDPMQSQFAVDEVKYPQYVINHCAKTYNKPVMVWCKPNKEGRFIFDLFDGISSSAQSADSLLERVINYLKAVADIDPLFDIVQLPDVLKASQDGVEWMRQYIGGENGPWARAELPEHNSILKLTDEELERFLEELKKTFGEESSF